MAEYPLNDIRSSSNSKYLCKFGLTRDKIECQQTRRKRRCNNTEMCPYKKAEHAFKKSFKGLTNMAYLARVPDIENTWLSIIDECHKLPETVISAATNSIVVADDYVVNGYITEKSYDIFMELKIHSREVYIELPIPADALPQCI